MSQNPPPKPTSPEPEPDQAQPLTHLDRDGAARMVDVGHKPMTQRKATAQALITMKPDTRSLLLDQKLPKGDALQVARVAGIMAAKRTWELIPLCHPIPLTKIEIDFQPIEDHQLHVSATVHNLGQTGVEMEALTACSIAALTVYDMAKAVDPSMQIDQIRLEEKEGGKRGHWTRDNNAS